MEWFSNWWGTLDVTLQVLYCIALPASLLLIIQSILIVIGSGTDMDGGGLDFDGDGVSSGEFGAASLFTLQGVSSFFCVFGWVAIFMYRSGLPLILGIVAGGVLGFVVMFVMAKLMQSMSKLEHTGTLQVSNLVVNIGTVYLTIPPKGEGTGKVTVQTGERLVEFEAVGNTSETIANNTQVRVTNILGENILVVEMATQSEKAKANESITVSEITAPSKELITK